MRHGRAYWVRMDEMERPWETAEVSAAAVDRTHVSLDTENLSALSLRRVPELFDADRPLFVTVDGERVIFPPGKGVGEWVRLRRLPQAGWRDADTVPQPSGPRQRRGLEGPADEALRAPFVLVVGTASPDKLVRELWFGEARRFQFEWRRRHGRECPLVLDVDCTDDLAAQRNLILFGGSDHNRAAARIEPRLPIGELALQVRSPRAQAAEPLLNQPDVGLITVHPNPLHPERLVVLIKAGGAEAIYQAWGRFGNWFNWGVFDSMKYFDYAIYDGRSASPETLLLVGYYGNDWSVAKGTHLTGDERIRASFGVQHFPPLASPPPDDALDLVNLRPAAIDQMRGSIGIQRTFWGEDLPGAIGVRADTTVTYRIDGAYDTFVAGGRLINPLGMTLCQPRLLGEKVAFIVRGDGKQLAKKEVTWKTPNVEIKAAVTGVKELELACVVSGGPGWLHAGAAWTRPQLSR